jgi:predicted nucleotidyltransferase
MSNITQKWVELLKPFSNDYSAKISASGLARKTKIPQQTASRILKELTKSNMINYEIEGKNKNYYLDIRKKDTKIILDIIENQKSLEFQYKNKAIAIIINELLDYSDTIIIFGSYASGKIHEKSDLDVVIFNGNKIKLIKVINKQTIKISEHYTNYEEFEELLKKRNPLTIEILKNHVLFGDVSRIVGIFWRREYERR